MADQGIHGRYPELLGIVGRLKYRSTCERKLLQDSSEVVNLCATIASEIR